MARILGIDYGSKRVGLAISDELGIIAFPLSVIENISPRRVAEAICKIVYERQVEALVLGLPVSMNGTKGPAVENVEKFAEVLKRHVNIPIKFWDERLSTKIAERAMIEGGMSRAHRRECIDKATAQIILQSYLDAQAKQEIPDPEMQGAGEEDNQDQS